MFDRIAEGRGAHVALRFGDRAWTYAEVADRARALAAFFVDRTAPPFGGADGAGQAHAGGGGLTREERVYVVLPDLPPFAWSIFGILAAGGVLAMGNPASPADDLAYVIDYIRAGPR